MSGAFKGSEGYERLDRQPSFPEPGKKGMNQLLITIGETYPKQGHLVGRAVGE
jgi:hypothetical protein